MPRILHLITDLQMGGESNILLRLLPALESRGFRNILVCLTENLHRGKSPGENLLGEFQACGVRVVSLGWERKRDLRPPLRLASLLKEERPHILHTYLFHPNVLGRMLGRLFRIPVVVSNVVSVDAWKKPYHVLAERWTSCFADRILVNANAIRDVLVRRDRVDPAKIDVLYNGVEVDKFILPPGAASAGAILDLPTPEARPRPTLGAVGRLHRAKGLVHLLHALRRLKDALPVAPLLVLAGDGPERANLEREADRLGLQDDVRFLGVHRDVPGLLRSLDVLVLPSLWEGIPATVLEAMAAGVPTVATNVGGLPEVVEDGETGLLVPPEDPGALAGAILRLLQADGLGRRIASKARALVFSRFSFQVNVVEARAEWYNGLLRMKGMDEMTRRGKGRV